MDRRKHGTHRAIVAAGFSLRLLPGGDVDAPCERPQAKACGYNSHTRVFFLEQLAMNIVAMSDMHGQLPYQVPACDLLLLAGDLTPVTNHGLGFQEAWLDGEFRRWLKQQPARKIIGIAGNHDFIFEQAPESVPTDLPWMYLQDAGITWEGLRIWGTPWQPWFFDWAFNGDPERLKRQWALIDPNTDILVVHGPPRGYGDGVPEKNGIRLCGCPHLLERIKEIQPRLVVFGHIHEGRGEWQLGKTRLANVTILDEKYQAVHEPFVCSIDAQA
jgi:predicted phosphodiesterase